MGFRVYKNILKDCLVIYIVDPNLLRIACPLFLLNLYNKTSLKFKEVVF